MSKHQFKENIAVVIGINNYQNGIPALGTAKEDAEAIADILEQDYQYSIHSIIDHQATKQQLETLLNIDLPNLIHTPSSRLIFYFAGHGIALNGDEGPQGYLIPQDGQLGEVATYLPMQTVEIALSKLCCRHCFVILDCCFAGAFRWSSTRRFIHIPKTIHKERYDRFIQDSAWQVITSAGYDQEALDNLDLKNDRGTTKNQVNHSPFAKALMEALQGKADIYPPSQKGKPAGDGIITATELYIYLRDSVEVPTDALKKRQTPQIWSLNKHDKGEFIFLVPGHPLNLPSAPSLDDVEENNPYRGLFSYEKKHSHLFFGRTALIKELYEFISHPQRPLAVVLGASGSGKSSLVKAGLIPYLDPLHQWKTLTPIRPGETPLTRLNSLIKELDDNSQTLHQGITNWSKNHPHQKLLLVIDQLEELVTLSRDENQIEHFSAILANLVTTHATYLKVVITLRSDFESQFSNKLLTNYWQEGRFLVPAMSRNDLREVIEEPASVKVVYFQSLEDKGYLVDRLIDEVADMPGTLPLLSFALSELYLKLAHRYLEGQKTGDAVERVITWQDYDELGGVIKSLTRRADEEYDDLVKEDAAYKKTIRHVMLRMVAIGGELARRRVYQKELVYPEPEYGRVKAFIKRFDGVRLLISDQDEKGDYVEPVHDALVTGWQKLLTWKKEEEENLILQRRLTPVAMDWDNQQKPIFLWHTNPRLDLLKKVAKSDDNWLNLVETEFVRRSVGRKTFNTRRNWSIVIAVMLGLSGLTISALIGQRNALIGQIRASRQSAEANLQSAQELEALLASLRAAKSLKNWPGYLSLFKPESKLPFLMSDSELQPQVLQTLQKVFYRVKERNRIEKPKGFIRGMFFTPDGRLVIATEKNDGILHLQDLKGEVFSGYKGDIKLDGKRGYNYFSSDGSKIAVIGAKGIRVRDLKGNDSFQQCGIDSPSVVFSSDNKQLAIADVFDSTICLWDLENNKLERHPKPKGIFIGWVGFTPNGKLMIATSIKEQGSICLWELLDQEFRKFTKCVESPRPPRNDYDLASPGRVIFSPDGERMAISYYSSGGNDNYLYTSLWNLEYENDGIHKIRFINELEESSILVFSGDGKRLATSNFQNSTIRLWDIEQRLLELDKFDLPQGVLFQNMILNNNGSKLALNSTNGIIRLLTSTEEKIKFSSTFFDGQFKSMSFNSISVSPPDHKKIVAADSEGAVHLFNWDGKHLKTFDNLPKVNIVNFSPDGQMIAMAEDDGNIRLFDQQGKQKEFKAYVNEVKSISFSPNGQKIVTTGHDGIVTTRYDEKSSNSIVRLWNLNGQKLNESELDFYYSYRYSSIIGFNINNEPLISVAVPGGETQPYIFIRSVFSDDDSRLGEDFLSSSFPLLFSPDGDLLLTGGDDGHVGFWNLKGQKLMELKNLTKRAENNVMSLSSVSLSSDGSMLAVLEKDGTAKLWNIGELDEIMARGCDWLRDYLQNQKNPDIEQSDRRLCEGVPEPKQLEP